MHVNVLDVGVAERGRLELHGVLAAIGLRDGEQLVFDAAPEADDRRPGGSVPAGKSAIVLRLGVLVDALAANPFVPEAEADLAAARFGALHGFVEEAERVDVLKVRVLEALAVEGREFLLRAVIALDAFLGFTDLREEVLDRTFRFLELLTGLPGLVYERLGFLVVLDDWLFFCFQGLGLDFAGMPVLFVLVLMLVFVDVVMVIVRFLI